MTQVRPSPCPTCPYRRDVPSGVWARSEYEKLRAYDEPTGSQPLGAFVCHNTPELRCHGWAVVHSNRGHDRELLALRLWPAAVPEAVGDLFGSGNEAADHGETDVARPSPEARRAIELVIFKHWRRNRRKRLASRTDVR